MKRQDAEFYLRIYFSIDYQWNGKVLPKSHLIKADRYKGQSTKAYDYLDRKLYEAATGITGYVFHDTIPPNVPAPFKCGIIYGNFGVTELKRVMATDAEKLVEIRKREARAQAEAPGFLPGDELLRGKDPNERNRIISGWRQAGWIKYGNIWVHPSKTPERFSNMLEHYSNSGQKPFKTVEELRDFYRKSVANGANAERVKNFCLDYQKEYVLY